MDRLEKLLSAGGVRKDLCLLGISGISLLCSIFSFSPAGFNMAWIAVILCGIPIILEAAIGLITAFDIRADVLVSIALIASLIIGEIFAAGEVAFIMQLGALLEDLTVSRARAGIEKLIHLTPRTARLLTGETEQIIPADDVRINDILRVLPGETVPVDGTILSGETSVSQAVMTGEPLPVDKFPGDSVFSGTVNQFGAFTMKAEKVGEDSSIQRMIRLVRSADAGKAKIVGIADRWATWIVAGALLAAVLTWLITGQIIRAVTILVVFCPCALVLATPTAIMAAIGNAAGHGFLVREGDALERLAGIKKITFDKTGTLTLGTPEVTDIETVSGTFSEDEIFFYAACAEINSEHPLGKAVVRCYKKKFGTSPIQPDTFHMFPGRGVKAETDGKTILAGNPDLLLENGISLSDDLGYKADALIARGSTVIYISVNKEHVGMLALSDQLRPDASDMIEQITLAGVTPVLLTGDHINSASHIAEQLHISEIHAGCMPEDKLSQIETYQNNGLNVCMIGDGINDAPSLKKAYVGIAMGKTGSDIAVDAADIALVDDEIKELPHLLHLSKHMLRIIHINLSLSMTLNFVAVILAVTGILTPVVGALVHNAGSVAVIINSAFLLKWKKK